MTHFLFKQAIFVLSFILIQSCGVVNEVNSIDSTTPGEIYTSPRKLFTVRIPKSTNWAGIPYAIHEDTKKGRPDYDLVAFYVQDFGEILIASVRHIPEDVLAKMAKEDSRLTLSKVAYKVLYDWRHDFAVEPTVESESYLQTQYGESILRIYFAKKGSLLKKMIDSNRDKLETIDTFIAVQVVKKDNQIIYAIAENDYYCIEKYRTCAAYLERTIKEFFAELEVTL
jgi:hypothetical protein